MTSEHPDELAEAERKLREFSGGNWIGDYFAENEAAGVVLKELDRLRAVEKAAAALVEWWDDAALMVQDMSLDEMHALEEQLDALATVVRGEAVAVRGDTT